MSAMDDERLVAELRRRAGGRAPTGLADRVAGRVATTLQERRPWAWRPVGRRSWIGAAVAGVVVCVVGLAVTFSLPHTPGPGSSTGPAIGSWDPRERPLTATELDALTATRPAAGTVVVARVEAAAPIHGFRFRSDGQLDDLGVVLEPAGGGLAWATGGLRWYENEMAIVDAWLVGTIAPACPAPVPVDATPAPLDVGCGSAAWLTPDIEQPVNERADGFDVGAPTNGIRVQNGAYETFALAPEYGNGPARLRAPRRAAYLVRPVPCDDIRMAICALPTWEVVARVDPIDGLDGPRTSDPIVSPLETPGPPSATASPAVTAEPPDGGATVAAGSAVPDSELADAEQTAAAVALARAIVGQPSYGGLGEPWPPDARDLAPAQIRLAADGTITVTLHDYRTGRRYLATIRPPERGGVGGMAERDSALLRLSAWELARFEATIRASDAIGQEVPEIFAIGAPVEGTCPGDAAGLCVASSVTGGDPSGKDVGTYAIVDVGRGLVVSVGPGPRRQAQPLAIRVVVDEPGWSGATTTTAIACVDPTACRRFMDAFPDAPDRAIGGFDVRDEVRVLVARGSVVGATWDGSELRVVVAREAAGFRAVGVVVPPGPVGTLSIRIVDDAGRVLFSSYTIID